MTKKKQQTKNRGGRPVEYPLPEPIPDTPENIIKAIFATPPRKREDRKFIRQREGKAS